MPATSSNATVTPCGTHNAQPLQYACLDPRCARAVLACPSCLQKIHSFCDENLVFSLAEIRGKVELPKGDKLRQQMSREVGQFLDKKYEEVVERFFLAKQALTDKLDGDSDDNGNVGDILAPGVLERVKSECSMEHDPQTGRIQFRQRACSSRAAFERSFAEFKKKSEATIGNFISRFQTMELSTSDETFSPDTWVCHRNIRMETKDGGILFARRGGNNAQQNFCAFSLLPLDKACTFRMTVLAVNNTRKFVDFGLIDETKFDGPIANCICEWNSGTVSFDGCRATDGLVGTLPTTNIAQEAGFSVGSHCIVEYTPDVSVRFYNEQGTLDFSKSLRDDPLSYYLFVVLSSPENCYMIEKLI